MAVKRSFAGGEAWPSSLLPQQIGVPSARKAHVWRVPLLIAVKRTAGVAIGVGVLGGVGSGVASVMVAVVSGLGLSTGSPAADGSAAHAISSTAAIKQNTTIPANWRAAANTLQSSSIATDSPLRCQEIRTLSLPLL
ncbi:MAG: hypothetical protein OXE05_13960 [Chloroflexi bacterium]|nr:hypothetical protein [Chloroflexota bacterium]